MSRSYSAVARSAERVEPADRAEGEEAEPAIGAVLLPKQPSQMARQPDAPERGRDLVHGGALQVTLTNRFATSAGRPAARHRGSLLFVALFIR